MTKLITLTREEIKQYLPHREPMLLVDEMALYEDENGKYRWQTLKTYSQDRYNKLMENGMIKSKL